MNTPQPTKTITTTETLDEAARRIARVARDECNGYPGYPLRKSLAMATRVCGYHPHSPQLLRLERLILAYPSQMGARQILTDIIGDGNDYGAQQ